MEIFRNEFNSELLGIGSNNFRERMELYLFDQTEELDIISNREFKFMILDDHSVYIGNNIFLDYEAITFARKELESLYGKIEYIDTNSVRTKKSKLLKVKFKFRFRRDDDIWIIKNIDRLNNIQSSKVMKTKNGFKVQVLDFKIKFEFGTNSIHNGKYIEKLNKDMSLFHQIDYLLFLLDEELLFLR